MTGAITPGSGQREPELAGRTIAVIGGIGWRRARRGRRPDVSDGGSDQLGASMTERANQDPISTLAMLGQFASGYLAEADPKSARQ
jgi:hypothetical protein